MGGTDDRAHPRNSSNEETTKMIDVQAGDVLLLPAGYSHRATESHSDFTMIGSYPRGAKRWDSELNENENLSRNHNYCRDD